MKSSIRSEGHVKGTLGHSSHHGGGWRHQQSYVGSHRQQYQMLLLTGEYRTFQTMGSKFMNPIGFDYTVSCDGTFHSFDGENSQNIYILVEEYLGLQAALT